MKKGKKHHSPSNNHSNHSVDKNRSPSINYSNHSLDVALRLLRWSRPPHLLEGIERDLIQKFHKDLKAVGELRGRLRSMWNSVRFFRPEIMLRNFDQSLSAKTGSINVI